MKLTLNTCSLQLGDQDVERGADGTPSAFRIWRAGVNRTDHGDHIFNEESASKLLADQAERGNLFSFDVDHLSLNDVAPPEARKAVGWFRIDVRDGDLWACDVTWTDAVRAGLVAATPEWRYFSPAYETSTKTGEIVRLLNCALTNNPATFNVTALATKHRMEITNMNEYDDMSLDDLLSAMKEETDPDRLDAMKKAARSKLEAQFPSAEGKPDTAKETAAKDDGDDDKKDAKDEEKKASKLAAAPVDTAKVSASIAATVLADVRAKMKAEAEQAEITKVLASLPEGDRKTYEGFTLDQVKRVMARHHTDVLTRHAAAATAMPTRGADHTTQARASKLDNEARRALDERMGLGQAKPLVEREGTLLRFNSGATPEQATRFLASVGAEKAKGASSGEALTRVLSSMKGGAQ